MVSLKLVLHPVFLRIELREEGRADEPSRLVSLTGNVILVTWGEGRDVSTGNGGDDSGGGGDGGDGW